ncbi:hypothetical protein KDN32_08330 [Nocardioides sp. J2M5]|uniref:hypothetical protein n=1 Tax=Nocardioides palaemonis TaxID=2829810 RepID=UPI001BAD4EE2|nr:hypothetical protein [Nocardioides palaemonis]MBS2937748.1 hypothetical protein [Nocardioides palaemonis]
MGARGWRALAAALAVVLVALGVGIVVVLRGSAGVDDQLTAEQHEVAAAARTEALAFLRVDHRDMEPLVAAVLDGATGDFAEQYDAQRERLVSEAVRTRASSTGEVVSLGVADLTDDAATVVLAANSTVSNSSTDEPQTRYYRLRLRLERVGGRWLTSSLEFVR